MEITMDCVATHRDTAKIISELKGLGYSVTLTDDGENIRLKYLGIGEHPVEAQELIWALKAHKPEAVEYLRETRPLPTLNADGGIERIPFDSDPRYFYWRPGGQPISETEEEVKGWLH